MPWTCEYCGRSFVRNGQSHSCESYSFETNFSGFRVKWIPLYRELLGRAREKMPPFTEFFPSVGVMWKHPSTFASVKCTQNCLQITFYADRLRMERNPARTLQNSVHRIAHEIEVTDDANFDEILDWLSESYALTMSKPSRSR